MKICVVPTPKGVFRKNRIVYTEPRLCRSDFDTCAEVFAEAASKSAGVDFSFAESGISAKKAEFLHPGEYRLCADGDGIFIYASDEDGASYGFATLLQLLKKDGEGRLFVPHITVSDEPDTEYRGLMIDCARSFHTLDEMKAYVDICWFYKIKFLHIHFSDDESYTLPSRIFPKLCTDGRCFSFEEIAALGEYAAQRRVEIVPEVDTPGHSAAIQKAYPEIFGDRGIISFCERAVDAVGEIYKEVCSMFPNSRYIHIGGDESRLGWWLDWDECEKFGRECGFAPDDEAPGMSPNEYVMLRYLAYFIARNAETVLSCGKTPIAWEGFHKVTNSMVPKELSVMVFDSSYQLPGELTDAGFSVINCSWLPTYVVTPTWYYSPEDCYNWDIRSYGTINESSPYKNGMMRLPESDRMAGGQLCSWGDTVEKSFPSKEAGHRDELKKIRERLPYISENVWNTEKRSSFCDLSDAVSQTDGILDRLICQNADF